MSTTPMSLVQFGQTIKAKHPEYNDLPDAEVGQRVLAKYPQYQDMVAPSSQDKLQQAISTLKAYNSTHPTTQFEQDVANAPTIGGEALRGVGRGLMAIPQLAKAIITTKNPLGVAGDVASQASQAFQKGQQAMDTGESDAGAILSFAENAPIVGPMVRYAERGAVSPIPGDKLGTQANIGTPQSFGVASEAATALESPKAIAKTIGTVYPAVKTVANFIKEENVPKSLDELTKTTPQHISDIQSFPNKVESVRQTAVAAEQAAHRAASDAFPKFDQPIEYGTKEVPVTRKGPAGEDIPAVTRDADGNIVPVTKTVPETVTFRDLQETRSKLLSDIAAESRAVDSGLKPRFELSNMMSKLSDIDKVMEKAALDQGGPEGLAQLQAARAKYGEYMNDFHNKSSALKPILDAQPNETGKVVNQLLRPDGGARAVETLRKYGVSTSEIENILSQGDRPVRVALAESAKLRKAGSVEAYKLQRLRESLSQAETNEMPTSAQARLPKSAMKSKYPAGIINEIPGAEAANPRNVTAFRLRSALKNRGQKP